MLVHPTLERLHALGLSAMADAFVELQNTRDAAELSREDWLGLLLDREVTHRENPRSRDGCGRPGCARPRSSRMSTCVRRAASTAGCS